MPNIESSAISNVNYQDQRRLLYVTYKSQGRDSGGSYVYVGVPRRDYDDLLKAESKGAFINERIKPKYKCQRLREA
jgi:hypothetical protein